VSAVRAAASRTLSDREWNDISKHVKLPNEARPSIEGAIIWFRLQRTSEQNKPPAALVRSRLNNVARAAKTLSQAIEELSEHERFELYTSDFWGSEFEAMPSELREAHVGGFLKATLDQATVLAERCADKSEHEVSSKTYSKKYAVSRPADHMVDRLDRILVKHGCQPVSRAKPAMAFLIAVFKIADSSVDSGAIEEAARRCDERRGELLGFNCTKTPGIPGGKL
jgi:hypothetical protein